MLDLTFGEQVKIILSRKGMTIKELAETIEERTGKKMSRQNLTQRLGRDNFQEQDMRMIADILECPFQLSILADSEAVERAANIEDVEPTEKELSRLAKSKARREKKAKETKASVIPREEIPPEKEMTIGDYMDIHEELERREPEVHTDETDLEEVLRELEEMEKETYQSRESAAEVHQEPKKVTGWRAVFQRRPRKEKRSEAAEEERKQPETAEEPESVSDDFIEFEYEEPAENQPEPENLTPEEEPLPEPEPEEILPEDDEAEDLERGELNPYTGHEYESNSVRMHPKRIGYVQVYDRRDHAWTDMTEWAFLGYQERKKALLGKDYEPPIYLD